MTTLAFAPHEGHLLAAHLQRLTGWEPQAQARVIARARAVGVYGTTPMDVIPFVVVPALEPAETDTVCRAADLVGIPAGGRVDFALPEPVVAAPLLAALPPSEGWHLPIAGVSGDLVPIVDAAVAEFRRRAPGTPSTTLLAQEIWDRPSFGALPMRALHAARRLGFLSDDASRVTASTCTGWKRLTTVRGQIFVRTGQRAHLTVV